MKYKVRSQSEVDERTFFLEREDGQTFFVDIFTSGDLEYPKEWKKDVGTVGFNAKFENWLKSFVGKTIEIEKITPLYYTTQGKIKVISLKEEKD